MDIKGNYAIFLQPGNSAGKESICNVGDQGSIPELGRSPGKGIDTHSSVHGLPWWLRCIFLGFKITAYGDCSHEIKRCLLFGRKAMTNLDSILKTHYFANKASQSYGFSSSQVWMWNLEDKEGWASNNWFFWTVVLEKTLESPLDCKEIKSVNPERNQPWLFTGKTDAKAEAPIVWPPDAKNWLIRKDPDAGKPWRPEKGMTEDEVIWWYHGLNGHEFEKAPGNASSR